MMPGHVRRCVLYARLSISKEESVSIDRQLESTRKYAEGRGWEVVGQFVDNGVSATANRPEDRKGWRELLATPEFEAVVIWKVDRLARRVLDFLTVDQVLQQRGAGLVAVEDPIDMTTPMGRAFATILAVFGEMEAAAIASRVKAARAYIVADGRFAGGGVPYGCMAIDNPGGAGRVLAPDPERRPWLAQIAAKALGGESVGAITRWLDAEAAPLPAGRVRKSGETKWYRQTVAGILRSPTLAGMTVHNPGRRKSDAVKVDGVLRDELGESVIDESLAVISVDEFAELQRTLDARETPQAKPFAERQRTSALLSKAAHCDDCDMYMCRGTNQKQPVLYCPKCRQVIGRTHLDKWLIGRLLDERGGEPMQGHPLSDRWRAALTDQDRRIILLSQLASLRIRRGIVGRRFDPDRVLLTWKPSHKSEEAA